MVQGCNTQTVAVIPSDASELVRVFSVPATFSPVSRYFVNAVSTDGPLVGASVLDDFDFYSSGVRDGSWNSSPAVSATLRSGFSCWINTDHLGHLPSRLKIVANDETLYMQSLIRDEIITPGKPVFSHHHFFVRQNGKLRLIFDGRRVNARSPEPPSFAMLSHAELSRHCGRYSFAAKFDLANFYWNLRLAPSMVHLFGLRTSMGDFLWNRLPFGFSHSAHQSHLLAESICLHLRSLGINVWHYMDDFCVFADSLEQCQHDLARCIRFCESINVRVKARKTVQPAQLLPLLGVTYDLTNKVSSMQPSYFSRLRGALSFLQQQGSVKRSVFASFLGAALFLNAAYPGCLSVFNDVILWFNNFAALPWSARIDVSGAISLALSALDTVSGFPPCALQAIGGDGFRVYADATPFQLGVSLDSRLHAKSIPQTPIFEAEAAAITFALSLSPHHRQVIVTDNRGLYYALCKGRSSNRMANSVITDILFRRLAGAVIGFDWIPTDENPADIPSRVDLDTEESACVVIH